MLYLCCSDAELVPGSPPVRLASAKKRASAPSVRAAAPVFLSPLENQRVTEGQSVRLAVTIGGELLYYCVINW